MFRLARFRVRSSSPDWIAHWLRDTGLLLVSQGVVVVSTTAIAVMLARSLGPREWGLFSALLGVSLGLSMFVDLGLSTWLLRELSFINEEQADQAERRRETARRIIGAVIANGSIGAVSLAGALLVCLAARASFTSTLTLLGLIAYTALVTVANCLETDLRAKRKLVRVVAATVLEKVCLLTAVGYLVAADVSLEMIAAAYLLAGLVRIAFAATVVIGLERVPVVVPELRNIVAFVAQGAPFAFNTVGLNVIPRLDTLIVALMSATAAGYFALGDRIVGPALIIPVVASAALYPFLARTRVPGHASWRISGGMMVAGGIAAAVGVLLAPQLVPLVFGQEYEDAVPVVQVMLVVLPFVYASNPLLAHLYTSGRERKVLALTLGASVLGTSAIVIGQSTVGATGAAAGYVLRHVLFTLSLATITLAYSAQGRVSPPGQTETT